MYTVYFLIHLSGYLEEIPEIKQGIIICFVYKPRVPNHPSDMISSLLLNNCKLKGHNILTYLMKEYSGTMKMVEAMSCDSMAYFHTQDYVAVEILVEAQGDRWPTSQTSMVD